MRTADTSKLLREAGLAKLPFIAQLDQSLIDKMHNETVEAKSAGRKPFYFVDLAGKEVIPVWLTPEAVGGKFREEEALSLTGGEQINSLTQLGQALRGATDSQRFFRSFIQWSASFWRWAPVAVAVGHMSWVAAILHHDNIAKLCEAERCEGRGPYLAFLYDELARRQIAARALKNDPDLEIQEVVTTLDKSLLEVARSRLDSALRSAGLMGSRSSSSGLAGNAASAMVDQANAAADGLRKQQHSAMTAAAALAHQGGGSKGKGKGKTAHTHDDSDHGTSSGYSSKRSVKRKTFWTGVKTKSKANKQSGYHGRGYRGDSW